jgi:hypothetical protein
VRKNIQEKHKGGKEQLKQKTVLVAGRKTLVHKTQRKEADIHGHINLSIHKHKCRLSRILLSGMLWLVVSCLTECTASRFRK